MQGVVEKLRFSTNISLNFGTDTRQSHSYYETQIKSHMRSIEWWYFQ